MSKELTREKTDDIYKWDLSKIYKNEDEFKKDIDRLKLLIEEVKKDEKKRILVILRNITRVDKCGNVSAKRKKMG
jgi:oligoendopeptidase F